MRQQSIGLPIDCYNIARRAILARAPIAAPDRRVAVEVRFAICIAPVSEACSMYQKHALGMVVVGICPHRGHMPSSRVPLLLMCYCMCALCTNTVCCTRRTDSHAQPARALRIGVLLYAGAAPCPTARWCSVVIHSTKRWRGNARMHHKKHCIPLVRVCILKCLTFSNT